MEYIATFHTHLGAVRYYKYLQGRGIRSEMIPVPRKYSSDCGIAVKFTTEEDVKSLISEDTDKIYLINQGEDRLIYKNELG